MRFEEILPLMREGKKAYLKELYEDRYWIVCKAQFRSEWGTEQEGNIPWLSFACLDSKENVRSNKDSWGFPRWAILSENWEIIESLEDK